RRAPPWPAGSPSTARPTGARAPRARPRRARRRARRLASARAAPPSQRPRDAGLEARHAVVVVDHGRQELALRGHERLLGGGDVEVVGEPEAEARVRDLELLARLLHLVRLRREVREVLAQADLLVANLDLDRAFLLAELVHDPLLLEPRRAQALPCGDVAERDLEVEAGAPDLALEAGGESAGVLGEVAARVGREQIEGGERVVSRDAHRELALVETCEDRPDLGPVREGLLDPRSEPDLDGLEGDRALRGQHRLTDRRAEHVAKRELCIVE